LERHDLQFFTSYWLSWTIGAWIADVRAQQSRDTAVVPSRAWYVAAAVLLAAGCGAFHVGQYGAFQLWSAGFACFLYRALARPPRPTPPLRVLSWFGDFSYSLYLIHLPLFVCLGSVLFHSELQLSIWPSFAFMAVAIPVAYLFYRMFERPAMMWSASFKPTRAARVVASTPEQAV
ncbi:acyltransferase family protein, partial [Burkholderia cenocepacia]